MKKQTKVSKLGIMAAMLLSIAILPSVMFDAAVSAEEAEVERIPFVLETLKADKMPPVFFSHEKHMEAVDQDCSVCHTSSEQFFLESEGMNADDVVAYVHKECVSCHVKVASGKPTGPVLASCRSCHSDTIAAEQSK